MILRGSSRRRPLQDKTQSIANRKKQKICTLSRQRTHIIHARLALSAGVQAMRARICSASSCDMFARVVCLRLRRAQNRQLSIYPLPHAIATHYFLRLTRARGKSSQREGNALFDDFWYFSSQKSMIKEKLLYVSSRVVDGADPYKKKTTYSQ